ncbi:MAG: M23 family metallopeptidase [Patescibacteria group bacterium]|nr:M23 family metallopeptidase [Patescibacteria group bacterium]
MTHEKNHISLRLKKFGLTIINSVVAGLIFLFKIVRPVFGWLWLIAKFLGIMFFKIFILTAYKIYLKSKNKIHQKKAGGASFFNLFSSKNTVYVLILLAGVLIFINNLQTKSTLAEELGRGSMIFELAKTDEFSEIKEGAVIVLPETEKQKIEKTNGAKNQNTTTPGSVLDTALTKQTQITGSSESMENTLAQNNNPINLGVLVRTSAPTTMGTLPERKEIITYAVAGGDTVASIAKKFGLSINTILWENKLSSASLIRPGQILTILPTSGVSYTVAKKDTLATIAKKYGLDQEQILSANSLASANDIKAGQKLVIPGGRPPAAPKTTTSGLASAGNLGTALRRLGGLIWPTISKHITQYFTWRHSGLDIGSKLGLPIYAALDGVVTHAGWGTGYGNYVDVDHGGGKKTRYGHMSKIYVNKGQTVRQGEAIGAIGSTGWSTGPHLHFEYIVNGSKMNPLSYL